MSAFYSYNFHIFRLFGFGKEEVDVYRFMSKQFILLFAGLLVLCSIQFVSPPKIRGLILRKTGTVCQSFHISCTFSFRTAHGNGRTWAFTFVQCLFCKNSPALRADFFLHQCPKDYCFDVIDHALKIQRKTVAQTKLKQHVTTALYYLLHISAGIEKDTVDWWSRFLLYNSSQCLAICKLCTSSCNNFMFCTVWLWNIYVGT